VVETIPALTRVGARRARRRRRAPATSPLRRAIAYAALLLVGSALCSGGAAATVVVSKDFAALCDEADLIFVGTVTEVESRWADSSQQAIETLVTFGDLTWIYGTPQSSVTLRFAGGALDGLREEIAGAPQFARGERRVIFARTGKFVSPIVGFDRGALRVVDSTDGPAVAGVDPGPSGRSALRLGDPASASTVPLDVFVDRVRERVVPRSRPAL
jgi:hypothetical protein